MRVSVKKKLIKFLDVFIWLLFILLFWYLELGGVVVSSGVDGLVDGMGLGGGWDGCWYNFGAIAKKGIKVKKGAIAKKEAIAKILWFHSIIVLLVLVYYSKPCECH